MSRKLIFFPLLLIILALAACGAPPIQPTLSPTPLPEAAIGATPMPANTLSPELQPIAKNATTILTKALDAAPAEISILEVQKVEWSDASLGCPQEGYMYAQMITPGYLVKAQVNGEEQTVHMDEKGNGVVCPPEQAKAPIRIVD